LKEINTILNISVIQRFCYADVGTIINIIRQGGGLVHHVFLLEGDMDSVYIKIRKGNFASIPSLQINADDIEYEKRGLQIMGKLCPDIFPQLLHFSSTHNFLILENIFKNGGLTLKEYFDGGHISTKIFQNIGYTINYVLSTANQLEWIGTPFLPEIRYAENLKYRIGFIGNKQAGNLVDELMTDKKQIILGDLAPKNIGILPDGNIKFFDLDLIALGSKAFDLGYLAGHLILEGYRYGTDATRDILGNFLKGYKQFADDRLMESTKTIKVALASIIYRLNNRSIPYPIGIPGNRKKEIFTKAYDLFSSNEVHWHQLISF
jgi:5-methylthioribose kinase